MQINENTKISKIINDTPAAIDAIVSLSKHFEKLRIPILRKTLASRVTIKQAAKIGGVSVDDFLNKLVPLGFTINQSDGNQEKASEQNTVVQESIIDLTKVIDLDVRGILKQNKDPFNTIMDTLETLPAGYALNIINTFEPIPLINILSKKGYYHETVRVEKMLVNTYFKKVEISKANTIILTDTIEDEKLSNLLSIYKNNITEIDVRHLEMPLPMSTILNTIHSLPHNHLLFVHHKKVPKFLFPELAERGYKWHIQEIKEGDVKLYIFK